MLPKFTVPRRLVAPVTVKLLPTKMLFAVAIPPTATKAPVFAEVASVVPAALMTPTDVIAFEHTTLPPTKRFPPILAFFIAPNPPKVTKEPFDGADDSTVLDIIILPVKVALLIVVSPNNIAVPMTDRF